jgi:hypothetical protein
VRSGMPHLFVERQPVAGTCPECGHNGLERYPVVGEGGWENVTKCPGCLYSVAREPWGRYGPITLLVDSVA